MGADEFPVILNISFQALKIQIIITKKEEEQT